MDDDVEAVSLLVAMEGGYHGHAGIRRWWQDLLDVFPDYTAQLADEVHELGDLTLAPCACVATAQVATFPPSRASGWSASGGSGRSSGGAPV